MFETILVATDFSRHAERAFERALDFAKSYGSRIELLHAYHLGYWVTVAEVTFAEAVEAEVRDAVVKKLAEWAERASGQGVEVSTRAMLGTPSDSIVRRAEAIEADLIVVGTRGLGAVKHVLLGSVAERTVRRAPCPVLSVPVEGA